MRRGRVRRREIWGPNFPQRAASQPPGRLISEQPKDNGLDSVEARDNALDTMEVVGTIKWYDVSKGFGFIVPDNGLPDVLLHVTCLRRDGYQTAYEGARVVCEALTRPGGLQAFRSCPWTNRRPAIRRRCRWRAPMSPSRAPPSSSGCRSNGSTACAASASCRKARGIRTFSSTWKPCRRYGFTELRPGQFVLARYGEGSKGLMVAEIRPEDWGEAPSSH